MVDANDMQRAREYVDNIVWRLETLQFRSRYDEKTGKTKRLPTRIRRFSNGIPRDLVLPVLGILAEGSPYSGQNLFNGEGSDDEFISTNVLIRKDQTLNAGQRSDASYTIIQDLRLMGSPDDLTTGDYLSCSRTGTSEFRWDETDVESLPVDEPEQGVIYQISDVTRSAETDLFSYRIRKSVAITQHQPETVATCDKRRTVTTEVWDNVYGEPGDFRYDTVRNGGESITIPDACEAADGTGIAIRVTENEDCTFKVIVEKTVAVADFEFEYLRYRDLYKIESSDTVDGASTGLSKDGVEYADGVMTRYESHRNDDGTWRNRVSVNAEREVTESEKRITKAPRLETVQWTDTSVNSAPSGIPLGFAYGSYRSTKTPGGLFTNEYIGYRITEGVDGRTCEDTAFLHTHSTEQTLSSMPAAASDPEVSAGNGVVTSLAYSTDATTGAVTKREVKKIEHGVTQAVRTVTSTLLGQMVELTHRSQNTRAADPASGTIKSVTSRMTDGELFDIIEQTFTPSTTALALGQSCAKTYFEHRDQSDTTVAGGMMPSDPHVIAAGGGVHTEVTHTRDPQTGVVRKSERKTTELAVTGASATKARTLRHTTLRVTDANQSVPATDLENYVQDIDPGIGGSIEATRNPGGSVTLTTVTKSANTEIGPIRIACVKTSTEHVDVTETVVATGPMDTGTGGNVEQCTEEASGGVHKQIEHSLDEDNVITRKETVTTENNVVTVKKVRRTHLDTTVHTENTSVPGDAGPYKPGDMTTGDTPSDGNQPAVGTIAEHNATITKGMHYITVDDQTVAYKKIWYDEIGLADADGAGTTQYLDTYMYKIGFRNCTDQDIDGLKTEVYKKMKTVHHRFDTMTPFANRMVNEFGLYDGSVGFNANRNTYSGGSVSGGTPDFSESVSYTSKSVQVLPNSEAGFFEDADDMKFVVVTRTTNVTHLYGKGESEFEAACRQVDGSECAGSVQINVGADFRYSIVYQTGLTVETKLVEGSKIVTD